MRTAGAQHELNHPACALSHRLVRGREARFTLTPLSHRRDQQLWIVLPTYNEAGNVERITHAVLSVFEEHSLDGHVLIVDDNSPDDTGRIADGLAAADDRVRVFHRPGKQGLGPAYVAGFKAALEAGADLVMEMDADFSHDPSAVPALVRAAEGADVVLGSRYVAGGGIENWGALRRLVSRGGCWYARSLLGARVRDLTGGFKCFRREVLLDLDLATLSAAGYGFQIETTYRALRRGYRVVEIPIVFREREVGTSKMSWRIALEAALLVPKLRFRRGSGSSPRPASTRYRKLFARTPDR